MEDIWRELSSVSAWRMSLEDLEINIRGLTWLQNELILKGEVQVQRLIAGGSDFNMSRLCEARDLLLQVVIRLGAAKSLWK